MTVCFQRDLLRKRRKRACNSINNVLFLKMHAVDEIIDRLMMSNIKPEGYILDIGAHQGHMKQALERAFPKSVFKTVSSDPCYAMLKNVQKNTHGNTQVSNSVVINEEFLPFKDHVFSLVTSAFFIHWINDIKQFLKEIVRILTGNGAFFASFIGGDTMGALKQVFLDVEYAQGGKDNVYMHIGPFIHAQDMTHMLKLAGFSSVVVDQRSLSVIYQNPIDLMFDLRRMGEQNNFIGQKKTFLKKSTIQKVLENYPRKCEYEKYVYEAKFEFITCRAMLGHSSRINDTNTQKS